MASRLCAACHNFTSMHSLARFLLFYLTSALAFGVSSEIAAIIFGYFDYGKIPTLIQPQSFLAYSVFYVLLYFFITFPVSLVYYVFFNFFDKKDTPWLRYCCAIGFGILIGAPIERNGYSLYIGEFRPLKQVVACVLTCVTMELLRSMRYKAAQRKMAALSHS